jgi:hypothetical protein
MTHPSAVGELYLRRVKGNVGGNIQRATKGTSVVVIYGTAVRFGEVTCMWEMHFISPD